jgi:diguanylate cyclase (GGDEF)-like protein
MKVNTIYNFFNINAEVKDSLSNRRTILIGTILFLTIPIFTFLAAFNIFYTSNYTIAIFDTIALAFILYSIYTLKKSKNINEASIRATTILMIFTILYIHVNGNTQFSLIWTIFLPIFAFLINGKKIGLYFSVLFYIFIYIIAFNAIDIWEDGLWKIEDFFSLCFSSIILIYVMYMNEKVLEDSDEKLTQIRKRENEHIIELQTLTITDPLTKLYNRRYFNDMAPSLIAIAKRQRYFFTFFILDIDYFKPYNDNYGHIKGDDALRKISKVLKNHIQRDDDFIFRLGGEEFAGIILSDNTQETQNWIKSICKLIENLQIEHKYSKTSKYITASIGVASTCDDKYLDIDKLYALADEALYAAKDSGKNKMTVSEGCIDSGQAQFDFS